MLLGDLAEFTVVEQDVGDVHAVFHRRGEIGKILAEAAVAGDRDDGAIGGGRPCPHRSGKPETDGAQVSRHQHGLLVFGLEVSSERVGVVAHVDGEHGVGRNQAAEFGEDRRRGDSSLGVFTCAPGLLRPPYRPPLGDLWTLIDQFGVRAQLLRQRRRRHPHIAEHRSRHRDEPAQRQRIGVDLDDELVRRDTGVIGERRPEHHQQVGLVHHPGCDRGARPPQRPTGQRMRVRDLAFGLEGGQHRCPQPLGERDDGRHVELRTGADNDHRSGCGGDAVECLLQRGGRWRYPQIGHPALRTRRRLPRSLQYLHFIGYHQVGDPAFEDGMFERQRHQLGVLGTGTHHLRIDRDIGKRGQQIDVLKRPLAGHRGIHIAGQRQHRCPVGLRVIESGQQIRRTRSRDPEAGRGTAGELPVCGRGERGGPFMADTEVCEFSFAFGAAHGLGDTEVGVPDHAEDRVDSPVGHRLDQHITDGSLRVIGWRRAHVDAVVADIHRVGRDVEVRTSGRLAGERIEVEPVPGTADLVILQGALPEWSALVGAAVVDGTVVSAQLGQRHGLASGRACRHLALVKICGTGDLVPFEFSVARTGAVVCGHSGVTPA